MVTWDPSTWRYCRIGYIEPGYPEKLKNGYMEPGYPEILENGYMESEYPEDL